MCFHYSLTTEGPDLAIELDAVWDANFIPFYHTNAFDFPKLPVITQHEPDKIQLFQWGLIPYWVKSKEEADKFRSQTLNARSEGVFEKPSFRPYITNNRCLVPSDGFFEWMDFEKKKYPHYIFLKGHKVFCFAGIYSRWVDKSTGEVINSFSILTTDANPMVARIHNIKRRMPVILPKEKYLTWLQKDLPKETILELLTQYPEEEMANHPISKRITSRVEDPNAPEVIQPFSYAELVGH